MSAGPERLPQTLHDHLGHYVYGLVDPRDGTLFYVGKGQGDRVLQHEWDAQGTDAGGPKLDLIREIQSAGHEVRKVILRRGLTASSAFEIEAAIIDAVSHFGASLKNLVRGSGTESGLRSLAALRLEFNAKPLEIDRPTIIVGINKIWHEDITPAALWEAARRWWPCNPVAWKPQLLLVVARQIVRGAWALDPGALGERETVSWEMLGEARQRVWYDDKPDQFIAFEGWSFPGDVVASPDSSRFVGRLFTSLPQGGFTYRMPEGQHAA